MNLEAWARIVANVTDRMIEHVRPFGTPLSTASEEDVRLIGSGTFVECETGKALLTCEHVARHRPIHNRFYGSDDVYELPGEWLVDPHPMDVGILNIRSESWRDLSGRAKAIPLERFARRHDPVPDDLLFFRGFSGENARYGFGVHETNATGYCTQEKRDSGDHCIFELFWEPQQTQITDGTPHAAREQTKFENPEGFSGSLVWNTRYAEVTRAGGTWEPEDAIVSGLLRRWDQKTKTLLVWRVEHLREWLEQKMSPGI